MNENKMMIKCKCGHKSNEHTFPVFVDWTIKSYCLVCKCDKFEMKINENEIVSEIKHSDERFKNASKIIDIGVNEKVEEIRIRKASILSCVAKTEVLKKLSMMDTSFNFKGYVKISYGGIPLRIINIEPIEGTSFEYFDNLLRGLLE